MFFMMICIRPLAVIEAKRTCVDVSKGQAAGETICRFIEKEYRRRPVYFPDKWI